jgi:anti-anti-sigma regulatory factor
MRRLPPQISSAADGVIAIEGELNEENAAEFEQALAEVTVESGSEMVLLMSAFEVADGVALATAINALRRLLRRAGRLKIIGAPQMLGHNLYRLGMLDAGDRIELIAMRVEEPYG